MTWRGVEYRFESANADAGSWAVASARVEEALGEPYEVQLDLTGAQEQDPTLLLGHAATLQIDRAPLSKQVHGIVRRVEQGAREDWHVAARVTIVPALWASSQRRDTRLFQEMTAPEILEQILGEGLSPYGRSVRSELSRTYPTREYCVQYDETDLGFATRLMEEEGIGYFFDQQGDAEAMVLFDANGAFEPLETLDGNPVPFDPRLGHREDAEHVHEWMRVSSATSTHVVVRDFDWTQPQSPVEERTGEADEQGRERELYDYGEALTVWKYETGPRRYQEQDAPEQARIRLERATRDARVLSGRSRLLGAGPGRRFELVGHPNPDLDGDHYVVRAVHTSEPVAGDPGDDVDEYHNQLWCLPADVPWRPARSHPRPRIDGVQTATVVGPAGADRIHTDEHGRVKVQFHWDRHGQLDEHAGCWIRVAQSWAGPGWGFSFIPRIGMEVLVTFLEGDPDRPLVTGCVYNGDQQPPYALPDEKNKSTIKSESNPGGGGFNELRFDDTSGREEVFIHAQKDFNEMVLHDHGTTVLNNQVNSVMVDQTESVGGVQSMTVTGDRFKTLQSNETRDVDRDRTTRIGGSDSLHVEGSRYIVVDGGGDNGVAAAPPEPGAGLKVTGNYNVDVTDKIHMKVGPTTITADTSSISMNAPSKIELIVGGSSVTLTPGKITVASSEIEENSAGAQLKLDGDAKLSKGGSYVKLDGNAEVKGGGAHAKYTANAEIKGAEALVDGGGSTVSLKGGEATVSGGGGTVKCDGDVTATGGSVKLNP